MGSFCPKHCLEDKKLLSNLKASQHVDQLIRADGNLAVKEAAP